VFRFMLWAILAALKPKALVVAENLCLLQQLLVLQRRQPRPYLKMAYMSSTEPRVFYPRPKLPNLRALQRTPHGRSMD